MISYDHPKPRGETLENLIRVFEPDLDKAKQLIERIFKKNSLGEKLEKPSRYLPTMGIEIETFKSRSEGGEFPYKKIRQIEDAGIPRDHNDSFSSGSPRKRNKYEMALAPVSGAYFLLVREVQQLFKGEVLIPHSKEQRKKKYYPIHVNVGGIKRDFPHHRGRPDNIVFEGDIFPEEIYRTDLQAWVSDHRGSSREWVRRNMLSDCFLLARGLDATLFATSPERLMDPFLKKKPLEQMRGYLDKGSSGVHEKTDATSNGKPNGVMEFRTCEMWGENSLGGLASYLKSMEKLAASLIAFQQLPMGMRDSIWGAEETNDLQQFPIDIIERFKFEKDKDKDLALIWLDYRRKLIQLFEKYSLFHPASEYWREETTRFADVLTEQEARANNGEQNLISESRSLAREARAKIIKIIGDD